MSRVKFNVNTEYAYIQNFKILQSRSLPRSLSIQRTVGRPVANSQVCADTFTRHGIDRTVPVEALVKCKMQDNLEFLQWSKRFWDQYFPGHDYDAVGRRKSSGPPATAVPSAARPSAGPTAARKSGPVARAPAPRVGSAGSTGASLALRQENESLKEAVAGLEKERDFYFSKLRDIELLIQTAIEQEPDLEKDENGLVKNIQTILYSTEEGFEIPAEAELDANGAEEPETF